MTPDCWGRQAITIHHARASCWSALWKQACYNNTLFLPYEERKQHRKKLLEERLSKMHNNLDNKQLHLDVRNVVLNQITFWIESKPWNISESLEIEVGQEENWFLFSEHSFLQMTFLKLPEETMKLGNIHSNSPQSACVHKNIYQLSVAWWYFMWSSKLMSNCNAPKDDNLV